MEQLSLFPQSEPQPSEATSSLELVRADLSSSQGANARVDHCADEAPSARELDQFYTRERVAKELFEWFLEQYGTHHSCSTTRRTFLEPSAGTGAFLKLLPPGSLAYDIDPKAPDIIQADFLTIKLPLADNLIIIGNPPFGKNASMAVKFFNHAAVSADVIAFVVPRTFQKQSIQNRLHRGFHLLAERGVEKDAFIYEGQAKDVPTVFQIWVKQPCPRPKIKLPVVHPDFDFTTAGQADFAVQRVGANAGKVHRNFDLSASSHYFLRANVSGVEAAMRQIDFRTLARRTVGNPSLTKTELVQLYENHLRQTQGEI